MTLRSMLGYRALTGYNWGVLTPFPQPDATVARSTALREMRQPPLRYLLKHVVVAVVYGVGHIQKSWGTKFQQIARPEIPWHTRG